MDLYALVKAIDGNIKYYNNKLKVKRLIGNDSRPKQNCLYFILDYEEDLNDLIKRLTKVGASGVVIKATYNYDIEQLMKHKLIVIEVDNIYNAYLNASLFLRNKFRIPFIEVTGSAGKSTTKEMIGSVLATYYDTLIGEENYNAPQGVAYNLLRLNDNHEVAVLEAGMKGKGIIDLSTSLIKPTIGVITCIQRAHFSRIGSIQRIIDAKSEMIPYIPSDGILIINGDDHYSQNIETKDCQGNVYRFGLNTTNDIYATNIVYHEGKTSFVAHYKDVILPCEINTFGKYNVRNALIAILIGFLLDIPYRYIMKGLKEFQPIENRLEMIPAKHGVTVINDNFNANPESTKQLIEELPHIRKHKKMILVFGDIERPSESIREYATKVHYEIGEALATTEFNYLIAIGKWAKNYEEACIEQGVHRDNIYYFKNVYEAKDILKKIIKRDTIVVFKAQRAYVDLSYLIDLIEK